MSKTKATLLIAILLTAGIAASAQDGANEELRAGPRRWLVRFADHHPPEMQEETARLLGAELTRLGPYADYVLLRFETRPDPAAVRELQNSTDVVFAEREVRYTTARHATVLDSNDPLASSQWAHRMIHLDTALQINFGSDPGVTIAVLDTGVAFMAPDLAGTIFLAGYDFVAEDDSPLDEGDGHLGHGTFMAGVIAQTTHNSYGAAGIAFNATILPVRVVDRRGVCRSTDLARAIRYAVAEGASLVVIGVAGPDDSRAVKEALAFAHESGVAVLAPAGNTARVQYPALYGEVLGIGAVDAVGARAYYSPLMGIVDLYAPGGDLRPGVDADADGRPDGIVAESFLLPESRRYAPVMMEGTSAATAHAAAVAALLLSHTGPLEPDRLYRALCTGAQRFGELRVLDAARVLMRAADVAR